MNSRFAILASLGVLAISAPAQAQSRAEADAAMFQKKISGAQARIRNNQTDADLLKKAVKVNAMALAKDVLLRNGFTRDDLADAKIILGTGGGKPGQDEIEITAVCCAPKEVTIRRTLEYPTK